jgi:DNA-binding NarL/FixJ family response regulator
MKRLFIVGSEPFIAHAMRFALEYAPDANLSGMVHGRDWMRDAIRRAEPDLIIVDGSDLDLERDGRLPEIREEAPDALIVLLAGEVEDGALRVALDAGAMVCMPPSLRAQPAQAAPEPLPRRALAAVIPRGPVHAVPNGLPADEPQRERCPLTAREIEILGAVAEGNTNARIGRQLWVTEQTVKFHLSNIYRKLGVSNRTEASRYALMNGLAGGAPPVRAARDAPAPGRWSRSSTSALASTGLNTA